MCILTIVIGKFAIFSFGLIFEEKLFEFSSSFLLSIFSKVNKYGVQLKLEEPLKNNFSLKLDQN